MSSQRFFQTLEDERWQIPFQLHQRLRTDEQLSFYLTRNALCKIGRCNPIHGNNNRAPQHASEKYHDPFRTVFSPDHYPVAPADLSMFEFARQLARLLGDFSISPSDHAVPAPVNASDPRTEAIKIFETLKQRAMHRWQILS